MPSYKLIYFNGKVRAEPTRFLFHIAGVEYEDKRFELGSDEWKAFKLTTPLGQVPLLEVDGKVLPQSRAIERYVASQHGFLPSDDWGQAQVDVVIETVKDIDIVARKVLSVQDPAKKAEALKEFEQVACKQFIKHLEMLLKNNNGGSGWFVGDKITWADIRVFCMIYDAFPFLLGIEAGSYVITDCPLLQSFVQRITSEPKVAEYIKIRPLSPF